jgi:ATP-binding protein involved in chromosome partitioning
MTDQEFIAVLEKFPDPYHQQSWVQAKALKALHIDGDAVSLELELGYPIQDCCSALETKLREFLTVHTTFKKINISLKQVIIAHQVQQGLKGVQQIKNIIAIGSGKGGVGKSTVSANLAAALALGGAKVGVLDADIYGPSQPQIMGAYEAPKIVDKRIHPLMRYGIATMSIGYLVQENAPMIWRGPMVSSALQQLLNDTLWGDLDYLVIDLPPGTGDIQLTLCQKIPLSGAMIVTTPQDLSLIDARRALEMFRKVRVPILGVIENMSRYQCAHCGHVEEIFGAGAGQFLQEHEQVALLGSLPLNKKICADVDAGMPTVLKEPEHELSLLYRGIARKAAAKLSLQAKNFALKFPNIVIETKES